MARAGRPPTPEDEQLVNVIRLMNKHVELLDRVIRERSERDLNCVVVIEPERKVPGTDVTVTRSRIEGINYASERRKLVAELIEQALTTEALYPTRVAPNVPPGPYGTVELVGISTWAKQESLRLTESAPLPVKLVLERNKLRRMQRQLPQEDYLKRVQAATRAALETDDDEKTP
ncbi:MAG: hypothetical protein OXG04_09135 [Acidobacteria bacterium]|nr:hypothetical protein [Acidobacteriota bacterium]